MTKKKENKINTLTRSMKLKNAELSSSSLGATTSTISTINNVEEVLAITNQDNTYNNTPIVVGSRQEGRIGQSFTVLTKNNIMSITSINVYITLLNDFKQTSIMYLREYNGDEKNTALNGKIIATSVNEDPYDYTRTPVIRRFDFPTRPLVESSRKYTFEIVNWFSGYLFKTPEYTGGKSYFDSTQPATPASMRFSVLGRTPIPFYFKEKEFRVQRDSNPSDLDLSSWATDTTKFLTINDPSIFRGKIETGYYPFNYKIENIPGVNPIRLNQAFNGFSVTIPQNVPVGCKLTISRVGFETQTTSANFIWY